MNVPKWRPEKLQVSRYLHLLPLKYGMILPQHLLEVLKSFFKALVGSVFICINAEIAIVLNVSCIKIKFM